MTPLSFFFPPKILADIAFHQINIFNAPQYDNEDEETVAENEEIMVCTRLVAQARVKTCL